LRARVGASPGGDRARCGREWGHHRGQTAPVAGASGGITGSEAPPWRSALAHRVGPGMISRVSSSWRLVRALCAACWAATVLSNHDASAAEAWLTAKGSRRCAVERHGLAARIEQSVIGVRNPALAVEVQLWDAAEGTAAVVRLTQGGQIVGLKRLVAPSCAETLDAVGAVVALALSSEPAATPRSEVETRPVQSERELRIEPGTPVAPGSAAQSFEVPGPEVDRGTSPAPRNSPRDSRWRVLMALGADVGTLPEPTATVGAGVVASVGDAEFRALAWYGVPSSREEVSQPTGEPSRVASTRADFGAASLDYCQSLQGWRWLALCGGLSAHLTRLSSIEGSVDAPRDAEERWAWSTGVAVGTTLVYRDVPWQPQLELGAQLPIIGTAADASLGLRAALGAALPF
jgi:hypothetical protein